MMLIDKVYGRFNLQQLLNLEVRFYNFHIGFANWTGLKAFYNKRNGLQIYVFMSKLLPY